MTDKEYFFHQTPVELAKDLIATIPFVEGDLVLEPFKGEGAFYNNFPSFIIKEWTEITQGRDYLTHKTEVDWVVSNPPFKLTNGGGNRENSFWKLVKHYLPLVRKGICFLGNDYCLSTLTPKRLEELSQAGFSVHKVVVCNVKKWRGRYFFITISKGQSPFYSHLIKSY